jgi:hypothetical protein
MEHGVSLLSNNSKSRVLAADIFIFHIVHKNYLHRKFNDTSEVCADIMLVLLVAGETENINVGVVS